MELVPRAGLGDAIFGVRRTKIKQLFGKPDSIFTHPYDNNAIVWEYNSIKTRFVFYKNQNNRLVEIETSNPDVTFNKTKVIGQDIKRLQNKFFKNAGTTWEIEKYMFFTCYLNEINQVTIETSYDSVTEVWISTPFKSDEENYDWPTIKKKYNHD
jgi:hypothetical protein